MTSFAGRRRCFTGWSAEFLRAPAPLGPAVACYDRNDWRTDGKHRDPPLSNVVGRIARVTDVGECFWAGATQKEQETKRNGRRRDGRASRMAKIVSRADERKRVARSRWDARYWDRDIDLKILENAVEYFRIIALHLQKLFTVNATYDGRRLRWFRWFGKSLCYIEHIPIHLLGWKHDCDIHFV